MVRIRQQRTFEILSDNGGWPIFASEHAPEPNVRDRLEPEMGTGDPAFILAVPVEQFRNDFVFLAPDKYAFDRVDHRPRRQRVSFDDAHPDGWSPFETVPNGQPKISNR